MDEILKNEPELSEEQKNERMMQIDDPPKEDINVRQWNEFKR
jgi:hypothetical protein